MSGFPKAFELRELNKAELSQKLTELKQELSGLRVNKVAGATAAKLARIRGVRKSIARVLTVLNQNQRNELCKFYANKKFVPLDLRPKKTRAMRRRLTAFEASRVTARQRKNAIQFSERKFALKA